MRYREEKEQRGKFEEREREIETEITDNAGEEQCREEKRREGKRAEAKRRADREMRQREEKGQRRLDEQ